MKWIKIRNTLFRKFFSSWFSKIVRDPVPNPCCVDPDCWSLLNRNLHETNENPKHFIPEVCFFLLDSTKLLGIRFQINVFWSVLLKSARSAWNEWKFETFYSGSFFLLDSQKLSGIRLQIHVVLTWIVEVCLIGIRMKQTKIRNILFQKFFLLDSLNSKGSSSKSMLCWFGLLTFAWSGSAWN